MKALLALALSVLLLSEGNFARANDAPPAAKSMPVSELTANDSSHNKILIYGRIVEKEEDSRFFLADASFIDANTGQKLAEIEDTCEVEIKENKIFVNELPPGRRGDEFEGKVLYFRDGKSVVRSVVKLAAGSGPKFIEKFLTPNPD